MIDKSFNDELCKIFGEGQDWFSLVNACVTKMTGRFDKDLACDIAGQIILDAPKLAKQIEVARNSDNPEKALKSTICSAAKYRIKDSLKRNKNICFSQMEENFSETIKDRSHQSESDFDTPDYLKLLIEELELMAIESSKLKAERLRLTQVIVVDRLAGMKLKPIAKKYNLGKTTVQHVIYDMEKALFRVGERIKDPDLMVHKNQLRGKKRHKVIVP